MLWKDEKTTKKKKIQSKPLKALCEWGKNKFEWINHSKTCLFQHTNLPMHIIKINQKLEL